MTRWHFTSIIQYTNVTVSLKLLIIGTNITTVFCVQRKNIWFKITPNGDSGSNAYMPASLRKKTEYFCPRKWAYLTLKLGWFKISAGTNIGPQNKTAIRP